MSNFNDDTSVLALVIYYTRSNSDPRLVLLRGGKGRGGRDGKGRGEEGRGEERMKRSNFIGLKRKESRLYL